MKKVAFSREILALAQVGTAICYFFFQTCILVVFLVGFQVVPDFSYLPLLLLAVVADVLLSAGLAVFLSAVNVYLRDVEHFVEVLLVALSSAPRSSTPSTASTSCTGTCASSTKRTRSFGSSLPSSAASTAMSSRPGGLVVNGSRLFVLPRWGMGTYAIGIGAVIAGSLLLCLFVMLVFGRVEGNFAEEL